jgi:hypothetical protein
MSASYPTHKMEVEDNVWRSNNKTTMGKTTTKLQQIQHEENDMINNK